MNKKAKILIAVLSIVLILSIYLVLNISNKKNIESCGKYDTKNVLIGGQNIKMDVSDTDCKRQLGLSGRKKLSDDSGMLFIFDEEGNYPFWMKEMNFPIDIIWVNSSFNVTGIEKNLSPETYPKSFGEKYFAKYVLEFPAEFSDKNNIEVGNKIYILEK